MYELIRVDPRDRQTEDVLALYVTCAPMGAGRMFGYYLSDWEDDVRERMSSLSPDVRALVEGAIENNDFETLSTMGFEDPLFFFHVLDTLRLATGEQTAKGRGFTCMM